MISVFKLMVKQNKSYMCVFYAMGRPEVAQLVDSERKK